MRLRTSKVVFSLAPLFLALAAPSEQAEPRYDTTSSIDTMVVVSEIKEVAAGNPMSGFHLIVRPESAKGDSETTDVYLAPSEFLKDFECHFAKGDRVQVKGSRVKFGSSPMILSREVRRGTTTLYLRDEQGTPYWKTGKG